MDFQNALLQLLKGKRMKYESKSILKKGHIIFMKDGILFCETCNGIQKAITSDMVKNKNWIVVKK